jgi:hypothetical protein
MTTTTRRGVVRPCSSRADDCWAGDCRWEERLDPLDNAGKPTVRPVGVVADLVEYLVVAVASVGSLSIIAPALTELVHASAIRILDLVVLVKDVDGSVSALELDAVDSLEPLRPLAGDVGGMLSARDIEMVSSALRPGTAGVVLVTDDRWAEVLSVAAQRAGGRIIGGERIPASQVESALARRTDDRAAGTGG